MQLYVNHLLLFLLQYSHCCMPTIDPETTTATIPKTTTTPRTTKTTTTPGTTTTTKTTTTTTTTTTTVAPSCTSCDYGEFMTACPANPPFPCTPVNTTNDPQYNNVGYEMKDGCKFIICTLPDGNMFFDNNPPQYINTINCDAKGKWYYRKEGKLDQPPVPLGANSIYCLQEP